MAPDSEGFQLKKILAAGIGTCHKYPSMKFFLTISIDYGDSRTMSLAMNRNCFLMTVRMGACMAA
jgi:hypothetical protein